MPRAKTKLRALTNREEAAIQAGIATDPDNPELTDEQLAAFRSAADVLPAELYAELVRRGRGRPKAAIRKVEVKLRLDPDVLEGFKAGGPGWQTRMNDVLKREIGGGFRGAELVDRSPRDLVGMRKQAKRA